MQSIFRLLTLVLPIIGLIYVTQLRTYPSTHLTLLREHGPFEIAQEVLWGLCAIASFAISYRSTRSLRIALIVFASLCLFIAGEESSWGQHWFRFKSPEFFRNTNTQREFNVHNLPGVSSVSRIVWGLVCLYAATVWIFVRRPSSPLFKIIRPQWHLCTFFLLIVLFVFEMRIRSHAGRPCESFLKTEPLTCLFTWNEQEYFELLFPCAILFHLLAFLREDAGKK